MSASKQCALAAKLCQLRRELKLTLEDVERITDGAVAVEYLKRLETAEVPFPAPYILWYLASAYNAPYPKLMELIGHLVPKKREYPIDFEKWNSAAGGLPENTRHVLAIIEDETESDPFCRYRVRMLWRKMAHESAFSGWWEEPGGGGLVMEDRVIYWRELPAPPPEIAKHFTAPAVLKKYGARFGDHYPVLRTLLP